MKPSAVLLIDLENFYCSREDHCRKSADPSYDRLRFKDDLERLLAFARSMTGARGTAPELPFTVRRAYADFNAVRYVSGGPPQHYLRQIPEEVLSQGIEPVQVFRLSRGGKNAADMKMAMDASSLLFTAPHVEHFVLVTGDADFIPVILELKRHGRTVSVIGVTGATSPKIQRFVDDFDLFEDLIAAEEVETRAGEQAPAGDGIGQIAEAVRRLLARTHPLRFAAVKPLLSKELGHPFDPALFGCDTTGDFLRTHSGELGVVIRQGPHDSEIDLPNGTNTGHGNGPRGSLKSQVRQPEKAAKPAPEPHTAAHYKQLLANPRGAAADREGKVYGVPWPVLVWACDAVVPLLTPPTGEPTHTIKLQPKLVAAADGVAIADAVKHVRLFYPTLRAGLPVQGADGVYALPPVTSGDQIRAGVLRYIAFVLRCRLREGGTDGDPRPDQLAAVFEPGAAIDRATAEFAAALAEPAPEPAPVTKPATKPAHAAEEFHNVAGYVKLLKTGGARGSETEAFKVLPVPWPSVERICADAFDAMNPTTGGALPRDQLTARLIEAGKELYLEKYDQHVRRVLGLLRLAGDVIEDNGLVSMAPDVTSGYDLRGRALAFLLQLLQLRLEEREIYDPIRPRAFVAALEAGPFTDRLMDEVVPAIAWLYRPADESPPEAGTEPRPAGAPDLCTESASESGGPGLPGPGPEPRPSVEEDTPAEAPAPAEPAWDALAFDGVLPEIDTGTDPVPSELGYESGAPAAPESAEEPVAFDLASVPEEQPSGEFGTLDMAVITSEAVAAAVVESAVSTTEPVADPGSEPIPLEPIEVAPAAEDSGPGAIITVMPMSDWLPDGDPLFLEIDASERPIILPEPEPLSVPLVRTAPPPLPLFPRDEEVAPEVDRMKPPPLPRRLPPPLPPVRPHRAEYGGSQEPPESV